MAPRLDHVGLDVSDYDASKAFYDKALAPLGVKLMMEPIERIGGYGDDFPFFWIAQRARGSDSGVHVAFRVENRETVDAFHEAALAAGGKYAVGRVLPSPDGERAAAPVASTVAALALPAPPMAA